MNNLKKIRTSKKLSQFDLAKLSNIAPSDISRIENGRIYAHPGWRKRLSEALEVPEDKIFLDK
jgi:transcriptional regulator with XRE-family HTH domain